jgi:hypothetical protein
MKDKFILDATCGGRTIWFQKQQTNTIYIDNQPRAKGIIKQRPNFSCEPDIIMDFTDLKFIDKTFKMVVWDPPHMLELNKTSQMRKKYGSLNRETWQFDLKKGFNEIWRVLQDYGVLIFKWNEGDIPINDVLSLFSEGPLFGHTTGSKSKTHWVCFMKIPKEIV